MRNIMETVNMQFNRRQFVQSLAVAGAGLALNGPETTLGQPAGAPVRYNIKVGLDNFAVRAMKWKAPQLIEYAASLKTDSLFITDFGPFDNFEDNYLKEIKARAADKGLQIHLGSWSICPTSKVFKKDWGTAEEHLRLGLRMAKALGSPVFRAVLGNGADRLTEGGIEARIADTVKVCKACRSQALDTGVKIAIENHGGDMQAWELATLIEAAGKDYVGANIDSGNATWTMEDPMENLEILGPYVVTTSLRDSAVWESPNGATVQWTAMGEGSVDLKAYIKRFAELCPGVPVHIETISGSPRELPYFQKEHWNAWPKARARDFAKFVALAKQGKPIPRHRSADAQAEQEYQKSEIERSIKYCKEVLGLGLKT
jgi:sugar phosphate isomerase/epimerase